MNTKTETKLPSDAGGRPLSARGVRALAGRRAKEAIDALAQVAGDGSAPTADRVSAAQTILVHAMQPEHA
jgi:hypothetical protein